ncbi:hypothetical protein ANCCEY_10635 [Ancylostoma ceylanicum]|nr:hypothetical protein ANCCEY_10635 [Ancylostoma ceylanicum]
MQRGAATRQNFVGEDGYRDTDEPSQEGQDIFQASNDEAAKSTRLPTGTIWVKGPGSFRSVQILLDTGSELSFIDKQLADELKLESVGSRKLRINTLGSNRTKENVYELYEQVNVSEHDGKTVHPLVIQEQPHCQVRNTGPPAEMGLYLYKKKRV